MSEHHSTSVVACLVVTTSGRILLLWDQDDTLPFRYAQLAMLLASLFHFSQAQAFGHLELQSGFSVLISSDVEAQISVAVICATPSASAPALGRDFSAETESLQLGRLKSLIILQEFVRCYRGDIERLAAESVEQAKLKAEEYTLTNALGGFQDGCDGTLDEFIAFQSGFVGRVMETSARGILNSIMSWGRDATATGSSSSIRLARGFLMNAETGHSVFSTQPESDGSFFAHDPASRRLHYLHISARVQQLVKRVAKALHESAPALAQITRDNNLDAEAAVVVRFNHLSGRELSEIFVALRMLPTGIFASGVVFHGDNALFQGRESELRLSGRLQKALQAHKGGDRMLNVLQDPSVDVEVHVGSDGAPEEVWRPMDLLVHPLSFTWASGSSVAATKSGSDAIASKESMDVAAHSKQSTSRLPEYVE